MSVIIVNGLADLADAAAQLLYFANGEKFIIFEGDMAAGKTTFIKALCVALGVKDLVSSPTFSIVNEYESPNGPIFHFDFYRLKGLREAFDIGYEEYFYSGHYCLIEWPQKIEELLPERYLKVTIEVLNDTQRQLTFSKIEPLSWFVLVNAPHDLYQIFRIFKHLKTIQISWLKDFEKAGRHRPTWFNAAARGNVGNQPKKQ